MQTQTVINPQCNYSQTLKLSKISVIIPVHNEESSLPFVLADLPPVGRVLVVDNGSSDSSADIAVLHGALVTQEPRRGYGSACLKGIQFLSALAHTKNESPEVVVFIDGDYSDYPEELICLVKPIFEGRADFVLGSRLLGNMEKGAMPVQCRWGNRLACFLMWLFWGARYSDLGPFRAISWNALQKLNMEDQNFGWTVEMQVKAAIHKLRIQELPVRYRRRIGVSKISGTISGTIKAGYKILYTIAKYRWMTWGNQGKTEKN
ncbi:glycosyltransferase family 2 protein [Gimesia panareensis]|uniref:glycosyltransferase family 2 protein n=1 Tax=Gimesia panareensis TaxID=2527978 RepID=UPI001188E52C|nr:glycosyltransferase family 2 protein [Gimesia panareensis]QDU52311.1 Undecaprenyl-phosphate mannosyltransferase [Gimesia panareensis]